MLGQSFQIREQYETQPVEEGYSSLDISTLRFIISQLRCHGGCPLYIGFVENLLYANGLHGLLIFSLMPLMYGRNTLALGRPLCKTSHLLFYFLKQSSKGESVSAVYQGHQGGDQQSI